MRISTLEKTRLTEIIDCIQQSFANYFVPLSTEIEYWNIRFKGARVNWNLSFGAFDNHRLVGVVIHGVDNYHGKPTAFNLCTGVIKEYRGQGIIDAIYKEAVTLLRKFNVLECRLEVIKENNAAIKLYTRLGFECKNSFLCFHGNLNKRDCSSHIQQTTLDNLIAVSKYDDLNYSWENNFSAIKQNEECYEYYLVLANDHHVIGYFIINPKNSYIMQIEALQDENLHWVLEALGENFNEARLNNVNEGNRLRVEKLLQSGLGVSLKQYEMVKVLDSWYDFI